MTDTSTLITVLALLVALAAPLAAVVVAKVQGRSDLARERVARVQERRAALYLDVMRMATAILDYCERTSPILDIGFESSVLAMPSDDDQRDLRARIASYASRQVRNAYADLTLAGQGFLRTVIWST